MSTIPSPEPVTDEQYRKIAGDWKPTQPQDWKGVIAGMFITVIDDKGHRASGTLQGADINRVNALISDLLVEESKKYEEILHEVGKVYDHITHGKLSYPDYKADVIIQEHEEVCHKYCMNIDDHKAELSDLLVEEKKKTLVGLLTCNGKDQPYHRCSALHCDHCGICDAVVEALTHNI